MTRLLFFLLLIPCTVFGQIDTAHYLTKPVPTTIRTDTLANNFMTYNTTTHQANFMWGQTIVTYIKNATLASLATVATTGSYNDLSNKPTIPSTLTASTPLSITLGNIAIQNATTSQTGALTATDWNTFNGKLSAIPATPQLSKTANYTVVSGDFSTAKTLFLSFDCTSGNLTATLPSAASFSGYTVMITKTDATTNTLTISGIAADNVIGIQGSVKSAISNGTTWIQN